MMISNSVLIEDSERIAAAHGVTRHITSIYPSTQRQYPRLPVVLVDPLTLCANDNTTNGGVFVRGAAT